MVIVSKAFLSKLLPSQSIMSANDEKTPDPYALAISTQHFFKDCSVDDLAYGIERFGLSNMLLFDKISTYRPKITLRTILLEIKEVSTSQDDYLSKKFTRFVKNEQRKQTEKVIAKRQSSFLFAQEEIERLCAHLSDERLEQILLGAQELDDYSIHATQACMRRLSGEQKWLTYQQPRNLDEMIERITFVSGCSQQEAQDFCAIAAENAIAIYGVLSAEGESMKEILLQINAKRREQKKPPRIRTNSLCEQTINYLENHNLSEEHAQELYELLGEKTIPIFRSMLESGYNHEHLLANEEITQLPLEDLEAHIRSYTKKERS